MAAVRRAGENEGMKKIKVGLVGSGFISTIHAESLKRVAGAELHAVVSPTGSRAKDFAARHGIPRAFTDLERFLASDVELVVLGCPKTSMPRSPRRPRRPASTSSARSPSRSAWRNATA